jgi:hypothetical protein
MHNPFKKHVKKFFAPLRLCGKKRRKGIIRHPASTEGIGTNFASCSTTN